MRRTLRFVCAVLGVALLGSSANAARLYFSTSNTAGAPKASVPEISLEPGQTTDLYVWVDLKGDVGGDGDDTFMAGYGIDILATTPGIVEAVSSTLFNPEMTLPNFGNSASGVTRWSSTFRNPVINPDGAGSAMLAFNAAGTTVDTAGAAGIAYHGNSLLVGQPTPPGFGPLKDPMYDGANQVFLAQHIQLKAREGLSGTQSTGIILQVGDNAFSIDNTPGREDIFFGAGTTAIANNEVRATDGTIHARVTVQGGTTGRPEFMIIGGDPAGGTDIPFTGRQPVAVPVNGPAGKIVVDPGFSDNGFFDVFFDVTFAPNANTDLAGLIEMLEEQNLVVRAGADLPTGPNREMQNYDFSLHIPAPVGGGDLVLDFDFAANGVTGVSVNQVAVPEPSSIAIAALGLVAVFGFRRRKA